MYIYIYYQPNRKVYITSGFPGGSDGKDSACNGRSPEERSSYPLQYSGLENSMDRGAWQAPVQEVVKSWTQLND